jgi:hypothetical protein
MKQTLVLQITLHLPTVRNDRRFWCNWRRCHRCCWSRWCRCRFWYGSGGSFLGCLFCIIFLQPILCCFDIFSRHIGEAVNQVVSVVLRELVYIRHNDAFGRARPYTQTAVAAFRNVDIEPGNVEPLLRIFRCHPQIHIRSRFDSFNRNTIHRACNGTLITANAVIDVDIQTVASTLRNFHLHRRVLHCCRPGEKMLDGNLHSDHNRVERMKDVIEICSECRHYFFK